MIAVAGTGSIVDRLGVRLERVSGADATALLGVALRRNPLRAQLLVSRVLGKHIPSDPRAVRAAGLLLGLLVADVLAGRPPRELPTDRLHAAAGGDRAAAAALHGSLVGSLGAEGSTDALVLGFAETATALGHCVAEALVADYLHSTRRAVDGITSTGGFTEEHSHATSHSLLPTDPDLLRDGRPLVLVDDELSTGRTALNTITALHRAAPREHYVLAALVDARPAGSDLVEGVAALGAKLDVVSLARARVELPADVIARAAALRREIDRRAELPTRGGTALGDGSGDGSSDGTAPLDVRALAWPAGLAVGGRHGFAAADHAAFQAALTGTAVPALDVDPTERTLVLGTEELMQLPLRLAQVMADAAGPDAAGVAFSTSTRSPAVVVDEPDYALRSGLVFPAHDDPADGPGRRYAYNVATGGPDPVRADGPAWDRVVVVVDPPADTPALRSGLLRALAPHTRRTTLLVTP